ncbi:hypothetical protein [Escherichia coli]|uniref:hypothetical protein n=1 Tax=Escherichia coli TaxID=562 RepID=UPI00145EECCD|nr:hypothetical protein [Escherichia coli]
MKNVAESTEIPVMDNEDAKKKHRMIVTLTDKEYRLLKELSDATGTPMATEFMSTARELGVFGFISGVLATIRALKPVVEPIKRRARELVRRARSSA